MGAAESNPVRNMDKRTARREYRSMFTKCITAFREYHRREIANNNAESSSASMWAGGGYHIRVCVRKRPIFTDEISNGEFDCITCLGPSMSCKGSAGGGDILDAKTHDRVVIHDARMHTDMKRTFMKHHEFCFDRTFDESSSNENVYDRGVSHLVRKAVLDSVIALSSGSGSQLAESTACYYTCMVYGQTGSGKSFTMSYIYEKAISDIFRYIDKEEEEWARDGKECSFAVSVSFIEIAGDACYDLLNSFANVQLITVSDGSVHPCNAVEVDVQSAEHLLTLVRFGSSIRMTASTGVNDTSSRSHSLLKIYIQRTYLSGEYVKEGILTLCDLAGSEHRIDSMYHGAERRKEGAQINASLMALKECIRARAAGKSAGHHYRKSKLTMALKASFHFWSSRTVIIATVSPASKDTEHSLNTLRHACLMSGRQPGAGEQSKDSEDTASFLAGGTVETEECGTIDVAGISNRNRKMQKSGAGMPDLKTSNGNTSGKNFGTQAGDLEELPEEDKLKIKKSTERKAFAKLPREVKLLLVNARQACSPRQTARLAAVVTTLVLDDEPEAPKMPAMPRYGGVFGGAGIASHSYQQTCDVQQPRPVRQQHQQQHQQQQYQQQQYHHDVASPGESHHNQSQVRQMREALHTPIQHPPSHQSSSSGSSSSSSAPMEQWWLADKPSPEFIFRAIFASSSKCTQLSALRRQYMAILRLHGYPEDEIDDLTASIASADSRPPSSSAGTRTSAGTSSGTGTPQSAPQKDKVKSQQRTELDSCERSRTAPSSGPLVAHSPHRSRPPVEASPPAAASALPSHEHVRRDRPTSPISESTAPKARSRGQTGDNAVAAAAAAAAASVTPVENSGGSSGRSSSRNAKQVGAVVKAQAEFINEDPIETEIRQLEAQCSGNVSDAARFGLRRQIAAKKAMLLKKQRKVDQERQQLEAQRNAPKVTAAPSTSASPSGGESASATHSSAETSRPLSALSAAAKQQQVLRSQSQQFTGQSCAEVTTVARGAGASMMTYRDSLDDQLVSERERVQQVQSSARGGGGGSGGGHGSRGGDAAGRSNSMSMQSSCYQEPPQQSYGYRRSAVGAAAAPFGNDYS